MIPEAVIGCMGRMGMSARGQRIWSKDKNKASVRVGKITVG